MSLTRRIGVRRSFALVAMAGLAAATLGMPAAQAQSHYTHGAARTAHVAPRVTSHLSGRLAKQAAAHRAVQQLQRVVAPKSAVAARAQLHSPRDATIAFRNAWALRGSMSPADRAAFDKADARPNKTNVKCGPKVCIHWTPSETKTSFAMLALKTVSHIDQVYRQAGYRGPEQDKGQGGNKKTDIYMDDIGGQGLYGYCTTDQQQFHAPGHHDVWAYCVFDNNFSHAEFPTNTPVENLEVTAAHEYFHANQFAYDILDDRWFLEATATWAEDELYTKVNDNLQYLQESPLTQPEVPLDNGGNGNLGVYGRWIFFRYITEHYTKKQGILPKIMLQFWQAADSSKGAKTDEYSSEAIDTVLKQHGSSLAKTFALFADANLRPSLTYNEGKANHYPHPDLSKSTFTLTAAQPSTGKLGVAMDHLSSLSALLLPGAGLGDAGWKLQIDFDLAPSLKGSEAVITGFLKNGKTATELIPLDAKGDGTITVPFSSSNVAGLTITLVNASHRFVNCGGDTGYSCGGKPVDNNIPEQFTATAVNATAPSM